MMKIAFKSKLWSPMEGKGWTFATLPRAASAKLGKKGRVPVQGTINGFPFTSSAFPDGEGSHQISVNAQMRKGAGVEAGDVVAFEIKPGSDRVQVSVPRDLKEALAADPDAKIQWSSITPKARDEWVAWITSAKQEATRARRVAKAVEGLAAGKKRPSD